MPGPPAGKPGPPSGPKIASKPGPPPGPPPGPKPPPKQRPPAGKPSESLNLNEQRKRAEIKAIISEIIDNPNQTIEEGSDESDDLDIIFLNEELINYIIEQLLIYHNRRVLGNMSFLFSNDKQIDYSIFLFIIEKIMQKLFKRSTDEETLKIINIFISSNYFDYKNFFQTQEQLKQTKRMNEWKKVMKTIHSQNVMNDFKRLMRKISYGEQSIKKGIEQYKNTLRRNFLTIEPEGFISLEKMYEILQGNSKLNLDNSYLQEIMKIYTNQSNIFNYETFFRNLNAIFLYKELSKQIFNVNSRTYNKRQQLKGNTSNKQVVMMSTQVRSGGKKVRKSTLKKNKKVRKHQGIYQKGPKKGKLKPGFKYSGKKTKTGLKIIIKVKK